MTAIVSCLGVSHRVSGLISYYILTQKGTAISRTTIQHLTSLEKETYKVKASVSDFDTEISRRFKEDEDLTYYGSKPNPEDCSDYLEYDPGFQE